MSQLQVAQFPRTRLPHTHRHKHEIIIGQHDTANEVQQQMIQSFYAFKFWLAQYKKQLDTCSASSCLSQHVRINRVLPRLHRLSPSKSKHTLLTHHVDHPNFITLPNSDTIVTSLSECTCSDSLGSAQNNLFAEQHVSEPRATLPGMRTGAACPRLRHRYALLFPASHSRGQGIRSTLIRETVRNSGI